MIEELKKKLKESENNIASNDQTKVIEELKKKLKESEDKNRDFGSSLPLALDTYSSIPRDRQEASCAECRRV